MQSALARRPITGPDGTANVFACSVAECLRELAGVMVLLSVEQYTKKADDTFFKGTIGGHVRHCLDHIRALLEGASIGTVDYDHRARGTDIELNPLAAREEIRVLRRLAEEAGLRSADDALNVLVMPSSDGEAVAIRSSLGRELAFVLSHTIHHNATIKGMAVALGVGLSSEFGYAPSTLAHRASAAQSISERRACAH